MLKYLRTCLVATALVVVAHNYAQAAIAFEHTGSAKVTTASTTGPSFNVTCDGTAGEKIFIGLGQQNATTTVTVNSSSATEVPTDSPQVNSGYYIRLFYYDSPTSGSNSIAVTWGSAIVGNAVAACYSGAGSGLDSHHGTNYGGSATSQTNNTDSTTVVASNCWLVSVFVNSLGPTDAGAGSNTTKRVALGDANTIDVALGDSNGTVGTGSKSMTWTTAGTDFPASIMVSFAPSSGSATSQKLLLLGVGEAINP